MKAFKYTMIDMRRLRQQLWIMLGFGVVAYILTSNEGNIMNGILYLIFVAIILQGTIFNLEQKSEIGFVNMLPGTDLDRVTGRFMTGGLLLVYSVVLSAGVTVVLYMQGKIGFGYVPEFIIGLFGIGLIVMAIQNVIFYTIGKGNSQQLMAMIHMLPGFVMWFGTLSVVSIFMDGEKDAIQGFLNLLLWLEENSVLASLGVLMVGIIFTILGIFIATKIVKKKDFA